MILWSVLTRTCYRRVPSLHLDRCESLRQWREDCKDPLHWQVRESLNFFVCHQFVIHFTLYRLQNVMGGYVPQKRIPIATIVFARASDPPLATLRPVFNMIICKRI